MSSVEAGEAVLVEQNNLTEAVRGYESTLELDLARQNVLEVMRDAPPTTQATWQMMLSALRSRRAQIESRSGSACPPCVETNHVTFPRGVSSQEPPAADLSA
jgi:hypothetical protein